MSKVLPYQDMSVEILQASENPAAQVGIALSITMKSHPEADIHPVSEELCSKLLKARHHSMFEHVSYTFLIQQVSRSFLAQITRQRTAKPTSGSQHYQEYSDYPCMVHEDMVTEATEQSLTRSVNDYSDAIASGAPKEEARQLLPNACAVNYLWTIDARNLYYFLEQRLCNRNVTEMRVFSNKVLSLVREHFPELYTHCGPQCFTDQCYQDLLNMQCDQGYWEAND